MGEVRIDPYPLEKFGDPNSRILIVGQSGAGKTIAMYYMLAAIHGREGRIRRALGFSLSERGNGVLGGLPGETGILPKILVHGEGFVPEALETMITRQMECRERGVNRDGMIIMDDLMCEKNVVNCSTMRKLLMNGRQCDLGVICTAHGVTQLGPALRTNFEVIVAFNMSGETPKLFEHFFKTEFESFDDFKRCYVPIVNPPELPGLEGLRRRRAIVLDRRRPAGKISDRIFKFEVPLKLGLAWGKAPEHKVPPPLRPLPRVPLPRLCSEGYWRISADVVKTAQPGKMGPVVDMKRLEERIRLLRGGGHVEPPGAEDRARKKGRGLAKSEAPIRFVV